MEQKIYYLVMVSTISQIMETDGAEDLLSGNGKYHKPNNGN